MTTLKPCPFCGGEARLISLGHQKRTAFDDWGVECIKCGAMPWAFSIYQYEDKERVREICAEKWNRRLLKKNETL